MDFFFGIEKKVKLNIGLPHFLNIQWISKCYIMLCFIYLKVEYVVYWTYNIMYYIYIKHLNYVNFITNDLYTHNFY
jgi:hypothetical protein